MRNPAVIGAIIVAFITGLSPVAVTWYQGQQAEALDAKRVEQGVIDTQTLLEHALFTHADTWVDLIIPQTQVSDEAKLFLDIKFRAFHEALLGLVINTDFNTLSDDRFHAVASKNLNDTVTSYIADARRQGISDKFIDEFNQWHQQVVDILVSAIEANVRSPIHSSQNAKMYAILTAYDSALGATLEDVARTLKSE
jgi:hypothetical protein